MNNLLHLELFLVENFRGVININIILTRSGHVMMMKDEVEEDAIK